MPTPNFEPIDAQPDRATVHRDDPGDGVREPDGVGPAGFFVPGIPLVGMPVFRYVISRTGTFQMFHHVPSQVFVEVRSENMISLPLKNSGNFCGIDWLPGIIWDLSQFRQNNVRCSTNNESRRMYLERSARKTKVS